MPNIKKFFIEVKTELKKVSWSTRQDLIASTVVVLVSVAIMAAYIFVCDTVISGVINVIIR